jgi:hypothetical protein
MSSPVCWIVLRITKHKWSTNIIVRISSCCVIYLVRTKNIRQNSFRNRIHFGRTVLADNQNKRRHSQNCHTSSHQTMPMKDKHGMFMFVLHPAFIGAEKTNVTLDNIAVSIVLNRSFANFHNKSSFKHFSASQITLTCQLDIKSIPRRINLPQSTYPVRNQYSEQHT